MNERRTQERRRTDRNGGLYKLRQATDRRTSPTIGHFANSELESLRASAETWKGEATKHAETCADLRALNAELVEALQGIVNAETDYQHAVSFLNSPQAQTEANEKYKTAIKRARTALAKANHG